MKDINYVIPTLGMGGAENVVACLANESVRNDIRTRIICLVDRDIFQNIDPRIDLVIPPFQYSKNKLSKFFYKIRLIIWLRLRLKHIDGPVISFQSGYNNLVILSSLGLKKSIFVSDRSNPYKQFGFFTTALRRLLYPISNGVICQTVESSDYSIKHGFNKNVIVIPNPVKIIPKLDIEKRNQIVSVGRLVKEKGFDKLLEIFSLIPSLKWDLVIVGDGPEMQSLKEQRDNLGLKNRVFFLGKVVNLSEVLSESKIFAFTSQSEGYPNALIEAMAFPLPVIAFNCPCGPRDIITNKNGVLIPFNDITEFIEKLIELIENEDLRLSLKLESESVRDTNSIERIHQKFYTFIDENIN